MFFTFTLIIALAISLFILLISWGLKKQGYSSFGSKFLKICFLIEIVGIILINLFVYYQRSNFNNFKLNNTYEVTLSSYEEDSFLDAPTSFIIKILNINNKKRYAYKFKSNYGVSFQFGVSKKDSSLILINGYDKNCYTHFIIDLQKDQILDYHGELQNFEEFELEVKLDFMNKISLITN